MDWLDALLIFLAALAVIYLWAPPIMSSLNLGSLDCIQQDGLELDTSADDPVFQALAEQLQALGFQPIGRMKQVAVLFGPHWKWTAEHHVFVSRQQAACACLYRMSHLWPYRVTFGSSFTDGMMLWTSGSGITAEKHAGLEIQTLKSYTAAEVLDLHQQGIERLRAEHGAPLRLQDLQQCIELQKQTDEVAAKSGAFRMLGLMFLGFNVLMCGIGVLIVLAETRPAVVTPRFASLTTLFAHGVCLFTQVCLLWAMVKDDWYENRLLRRHLLSGEPLTTFSVTRTAP